MKNHVQELDILSINIEQVINLLNCFNEFCDYEGNLDNCNSKEQQFLKATAFTQRIKRYESLVFASIELLKKTNMDISTIAYDILQN